MSNRLVRLVARPTESLHATDLAITEAEIEPLGCGDVLIRNSWLSIDPAIRLRLNARAPNGYLSPLDVGDPLVGLALGTVIDSRHSDFTPGDTVTHMYGYRDYAVVPAAGNGLGGAGALTKVSTDGFAPQWFLGPLGTSGLTAFVGIEDIIGLRPDDVVWVSAAAGAVGGIATQLARLRGSTVVASAGSPDKVTYLRDTLGADAAFDYHTGDIGDLVAAAAPDGLDAYFDSVGGDHFDAALRSMRPDGRIAMCGGISGYETPKPAAQPAELFQIVSKGLSIRGFRAGSFVSRYDAMREEIGGHLTDGAMVYSETVYDGLELAPTALVEMLTGRTTGKTLCRLPW